LVTERKQKRKGKERERGGERLALVVFMSACAVLNVEMAAAIIKQPGMLPGRFPPAE
jgi:hypothetical protein